MELTNFLDERKQEKPIFSGIDFRCNFFFWFSPISFFPLSFHLFMTHHYLFIIIYLWRIFIKVSVFFWIGSISRQPYTDSTIPDFPKCTLTCKQINEPSKNRNFLRIWTSLIRLRWYIPSRYTSCLRWHFLGTHTYEIKSIDCLLKPEFVLAPIGNFENIYIALLRCTTIETFDWKYKTTIEGVFVSAFSDIHFRLSSLISI